MRIYVPILAALLIAGCGGDSASGSSSEPIAAKYAIGVYTPLQGTTGDAIDRYITDAGRKPAFGWMPMTWMHGDGTYWEFDPQALEQFRTRGIFPGLTWEPSKGPAQKVGPDQPDFAWTQLTSGRYDAYLKRWAKAAAGYGHPFILRVLHEMNGTWYPWGYNVNGNTNLADFVAAHKHIVDIFRAQGATNVQFVWNPTALSAQKVALYGGLVKQAYPGDAYVDWIALDGYNSTPGSWRTLYDEFHPAYDLLTGMTKRPMILFEVGSLEDPNDPTAKAKWLTDGFLTTIPESFPQVKLAVFFNSRDGQGRNFSFQTSSEAEAAWKKIVANPLTQGKL